MAHTIQETLDAIAAEDSGVDSVVAFIASLKQQLKDALASGLPMQEALDKVFDSATANAAKINSAMTADAGTPAPPAEV